jgi:sugar/nucleoside kinase (ribokinase family)
MIDLVAFGIILDDLVFPDGHTVAGTLGGGGPQTAFGMRLPALAGWAETTGNVGLVAGIGHDLPNVARAWLVAAGIDLAGVRETELPTPRAWQKLEHDGRRTQVWRVDERVITAQLGRMLDRIPDSYRLAKGFHLGIHPDEPDLGFIHQLRHLPLHNAERPGGGSVLSLEPFKPADRSLTDAALRQLCSATDIFSPNVAEAQSLVGNGSPDELVRQLADAGAPIVALRMGPEGSLVYTGSGASHLRSATHLAVHVPAIPTNVVDPTGAGNAYCGGFLAGYIETGDVLTAARYGAIAASFLVEQAGLPEINERLRTQAGLRLHLIQKENE